MCKYILENENCSIRMPQPDGSRYVDASVEIRKAFMEAAEKSPHFKDAKLGVGCGGYKCCFVAGKYATWTDCPFYESN